MRPVLIDAGVLVTLFRPEEVAHPHYRDMLLTATSAFRLHSTWPCLAEAAHLLRGAARLNMLRWVGHGAVQIYPMDASELLDMTPWMQQYSEPPRSVMDLADATLVWLAMETGMTTILTLDVRDFSRYRLPNGSAFAIL